MSFIKIYRLNAIKCLNTQNLKVNCCEMLETKKKKNRNAISINCQKSGKYKLDFFLTRVLY